MADHYESFEPMAQFAVAEQMMYAALLKAIDDGVPQDRASVLVNENFGREILADAQPRGYTRAPVARSGRA
ncbi:MAG: IolC myo-catabolism protein [Myxococcales bacterium]|nr:IolC myo-catabolism protein [Myxococcales bacterium]